MEFGSVSSGLHEENLVMNVSDIVHDPLEVDHCLVDDYNYDWNSL